jgi:hypothetical protein
MTQFEREVLRLLAMAHRRLDERGVPRVTRPVTTEEPK